MVELNQVLEINGNLSRQEDEDMSSTLEAARAGLDA